MTAANFIQGGAMEHPLRPGYVQLPNGDNSHGTFSNGPNSQPNSVRDVPAFSLLKGDDVQEEILQVAAEQCKIERDQIEDIYPCTSVQEGLIALSIRNPNTYVARYVYAIPQNADLEKFKAAWDTTVNAHTILRTRIVQKESAGTFQVVLRGRVEWETSNNLQVYLAKDCKKQMQLGTPLIRVGMVEHAEKSGKKYFVLTLHHALYDDWGLRIVLGGIEKAYLQNNLQRQAFNRFTAYSLSSHWSMSEDFWRLELANMSASVFPTLPSNTYRPVATMSLERLIQLGNVRDQRFMSTIVKLGWSILLSQYTDSNEVVFGVTTTGRDGYMPGIEAMSGVTIATVPFRVRFKSDQRVEDALHGVRDQEVRMIPFEQLGLHTISRLGPDAAAASRFQCLLVMQPEPHPDSYLFHEVTQEQDLSNHATFGTYALTLVCNLDACAVRVQAVYDENVIPERQMQWMLDQFAQILRRVNIEPDTRVADLTSLGQENIIQLESWNGEVPERASTCMHTLISQQCLAQPNAPAVCTTEGTMSYGELDKLSSKLATYLINVGVGPEVFVALCFNKSKWTTVAILAVMKAGGAFVLFDPTYPLSRLQEICGDIRATIVLCSVDNITKAEQIAKTVIPVGESWPACREDQCDPMPSKVQPHNALYAIFTSGSTGKPKGLVIEHDAFCSSAKAYIKAAGLDRNTRALQFASYAFDVSISDTLVTLLAGGCICVPTDIERDSGLIKAIRLLEVNWADLTPSFLRSLSPQDLPTIRTLVLGGESMSKADIAEWSEHVRLINIYGPAECCVLSTVQPHVTKGSNPSNIGFATGSVCWIVDKSDHNKLMPIGAVGELLIEGPIVGRGYINEPDKTQSVFINKPPRWLQHFRRDNSVRRLYKTGDLVQYNVDGSIRFIGRKDLQVKLRGQRIELGDVEYHIRQSFPGVKHVVAEVVVLAGEGARPMLTAFVISGEATSHEQREADENNLLDVSSTSFQEIARQTESQLRDHLPRYMVPEIFIPLRYLPLTATGKTDRRKLREKASSLSREELLAYTATDAVKRQPSTPIERTLHQLLQQLLKLSPETIGMDDSFFYLGGDSILAMKLVGMARKAGVALTVGDVFNHPKLSDLARVMHKDVLGSIPQMIPSSLIEEENREYPIETAMPQSFAQERLWFLDQLHPGLTWYLMPYAMRLRGPLRLDALNTALLALENRHESLRTTFAARGGVNMQIVRPFRPKELNIVDILSGHEEDLLHALHQDQSTPFNLETELGWRVSVYRLGRDDHVLSIVMHHIISDGWSLDILRRELAIFYSAAICGEDPLSKIEPLPIQYRDYSVWQKQEHQADEHQRQLDYWVTQLETSRPAELLPDKPRPSTLSGHAGVQELRIEGALYDNLQRFCKEREVTPFIVLLAAFRATHYRLTGASDATIGTANANRDRWEVRDVIGFFVNLQCIRIKIEGESFEELVRQVQSTTIASFANQDVPFERIVSKLQVARDLSRNPLVQMAFALHSQLDLRKFTFEGVQTELLGQAKTSRFDLEFHIYQEQHALQGRILFSTDLYESATINSMLSVFHEILQQGLSEPTAAIASLPLLTDNDYSALDKMDLVQIHTTDYPRELSVVDVFRQQVAANPDRVAVKDDSSRLTYSQLDKSSDVLACWLARRSFAAETIVGVFAARSCHTIIAFLGILKASLAYLPLDVKAPVARMETILSSIRGHKLVLVGSDVQPPPTQMLAVEFVSIATILHEEYQISPNAQAAAMIPSPLAASLAYVMFTSGSTGQPKGVMVEHRSILRLVKQSNMAQYLPVPLSMAHIANIAFDASTWEIYAALLNGGTLVCVGYTAMLDCFALAKIFSQEKVGALLITPALLKQYLLECPATLSMLHTLYVGGDRAEPGDLASAQTLMNGYVLNAYGPTENTVASTIYCLLEGLMCANGVPIGRALSNSGAYVMDPQQRLVPIGVVGELVVTGDGLARGYTDPQQDVGKFVSVMIGGEQVRAYRTGDHVRYRPVDGQLEFFGRIDGQVKIRGQRVELGEIEHVLRSHNAVDDAVALVQIDDGQKSRIVSFVTVHEDNVETDKRQVDGQEIQHVETWESSFNSDIYTHFDDVQPEILGRDFIGWTSMYDGSDIDKQDMNEWLDDTIETILHSGSPIHVLEIGTGSGMILFNLAKELQSYIGLEPSERAVDFITKRAKSIPALTDKVHMYKATAADIDRLAMPTSPNLVVTNSVVQYFPSQDYLFRLVEDLLQLEDVRTLFFGDIRSHALYKQFLVTRALHVAGENASKAEFQRVMVDMERAESELLIDPAFFTALPDRLPDRIKHVEIIPKRMHASNDLSCYRYAAAIHVKAQGHQHHPDHNIHSIGREEWIDFVEQGLDRQSLLQVLQDPSSPPTVAVSNIPHAKTIFERQVVDSLDNGGDDAPNDSNWLSSLRQSAQQCASLATTDLVELAHQAGYRVELSWARQHSQRGGLDAIFHHYQPIDGQARVLFHFPSDHQGRPNHTLSSQPLRQKMRKRIQEELHEKLQAQLPPYMVPNVVNILDKMPVNANGKVDRPALAEMAQSRTAAYTTENAEERAPTTDREILLQTLFAQVLTLETTSVGADDSFFRLGGDSIAAMKLVGAAREKGLALTVADIFRHPKLSDLAQVMCDAIDSSVSPIAPFALLDNGDAQDAICQVAVKQCGVEEGQIEDIYPCTALQEGLMALTAKKTGAYVVQSVYELPTGVDLARFHAAWEATVKANSILRTRIIQTESRGTFQVVIRGSIKWEAYEDLGAYAAADAGRLIGLGGPLARFAVTEPQGENGRSLFILTLHHALYDGWSLSLVLGQVSSAYQGQKLQTQPFNSFIAYLSTADSSASEDFWRSEFADFSAVVFPALPSATYTPVAAISLEHSIDVSRQAETGFTMSTAVRLAWAIVLSRYTDSNEVIFGVTVAGRSAPVAGIELMTGPTIATVPLRIRMRSDAAVKEALQDIQCQSIAMVPFEQAGLQNIARLGPEAAAACQFQSLLVIQPESDAKAPDIFAEPKENSDDQDAPFDSDSYALTLQCNLSRNSIDVQATFDVQTIAEVQMQRILLQFEHVLQQVIEQPEMQIRDVSAFSSNDSVQLRRWNQELPTRLDRCMHDLISQRCLEQPDAPAVCSWDGDFTYGELDQLSSRLAAHLASLGVGPEVFVPLCFEKSKWTTVAMLGVMKAGGAFVLLDPSHPVKRLQGICQDVGAKLAVCSTQNAVMGAALATVVVTIGEGETAWRDTESDWTGSSVEPHNALYVVFTSGTTGKPKGVVIEHAAFCTSAKAQSGVSILPNNGSRVLQFASYAFDVSISESLITLFVGGCVCVPSEIERNGHITKAVQRMQVNWADLPPSLLKVLRPSGVPTLKTLVFGGETMPYDDLIVWSEQVHLINSYGPAECSIICAVQPKVNPASGPNNIGYATGGVCWIVDQLDHDKLAPIGAVGELLIEGPILGRGYINDEEKTRAVFIESPPWLQEFRQGGRGRLYKTGDLVQYNPDGSIRFIGRKDTQVKLRGQRIELGEVEEHVRRCFRNVRDVVAEVVVPAGNSAVPVLAAFVCTEQHVVNEVGEAGEESQLSGAIFDTPSEAFRSEALRVELGLRDQLPSYMVPGVFIPLQHVPLSSTGKTDRRLLRQQSSALSRSDLAVFTTAKVEKRSPSTDEERTLQTLFAVVLNLQTINIGADNNFFRLGGDSIAAMKLVGKAREEGLTLTVADVFNHPKLSDLSLVMCDASETTVRDVAPFELVDSEVNLPSPKVLSTTAPEPFSLIDGSLKDLIVKSSKPFVELRQIADIQPLSSFQAMVTERYFSRPSQGLYHLFLDFKFDIDVEHLGKSCNNLLRHYSVLRSIFIPSQGQYWQVVLKELTLSLSVLDTTDDLTALAHDICLKDAKVGLQPGHSPVYFKLIRNKSQGCRLIFQLSHAQYDGVSLPIIIQSLLDLYQGIDLPPQTEFSVYLRHRRHREATSAAYWRNFLRGSSLAKVLPLLSSPACIAAQSNIPRDVIVEQVLSLPELPDSIFLPTVVSAAWALILSRITEEQDVVYGNVVYGRNAAIPGIEHVVGPCMNYVPVRVQIHPNMTSHELLRSIQQQQINIGEADSFGLDDIVKHSTEWPTGSQFHSVVQHQNFEWDSKFELSGDIIELDGFKNPYRVSPSMLKIYSYPVGRDVRLKIQANDHIISTSVADYLLACLCDTIIHLLAEPQMPLPCHKLHVDLNS